MSATGYVGTVAQGPPGPAGATGAPGPAGATGPVSGVTAPSDVSYVSWNYDPVAAVNTLAPTGGVLYLLRLQIRDVGTLSKVWMGVASTTGATPTAGQNFIGLYNSAGTLMRATADLTTALSATGEQGYTLSASVSVTPGYYWVGLLLNGATLPTFVRASGAVFGLSNGPSTTATKRIAKYGTGLTALPSALTLANLADTGNSFWVGVS